MNGTIQRNLFDRAADAWRAWKAIPQPGQLYPPSPYGIQTGYLTFPGWPYLDRQTGTNDQERVKTAMQSVWAYSDVMTIANELTAAELLVKERVGEKLEDVDNHPLELLWEGPNPHMGRSFVVSYWAQSYTYTGKAYLYWVPGPDGPAEVWPIPPFMMMPIPDEQAFIKAYAFKAKPDATPIIIPPEYITYSHSVNLFDIRDGMSFLAAAMSAIKSDLAMAAWNLNFFDSGNGLPDGAINVNKDMLDQDIARVRQEMREFFGGTQRGIAVLRAGDAKYEMWGRSQKDMEFTQGRDTSSKEIDRALLFPEGYWSETANRANAEQARATMIAGAVWPLAVRLAEDLNISVVPRWYGEQYRVEFKDIRPEDRELKIKEVESRKAYWTIGELRELDGKDPLGDVRDLMLPIEIEKQAATPTSIPDEEISEAQQEKADEQAALAPPEPPPTEQALQGGEMPMNEDMMPMDEQPMPPMKTADLDRYRWERKALKSLRRFHTASVRFDSVSIPPDEHARISAALTSAQTASDVRAAFAIKAEADDLIDEQWPDAVEWVRKAGG